MPLRTQVQARVRVYACIAPRDVWGGYVYLAAVRGSIYVVFNVLLGCFVCFVGVLVHIFSLVLDPHVAVLLSRMVHHLVDNIRNGGLLVCYRTGTAIHWPLLLCLCFSPLSRGLLIVRFSLQCALFCTKGLVNSVCALRVY